MAGVLLRARSVELRAITGSEFTQHTEARSRTVVHAGPASQHEVLCVGAHTDIDSRGKRGRIPLTNSLCFFAWSTVFSCVELFLVLW